MRTIFASLFVCFALFSTAPAAEENNVTIFIVGDSTAAAYSENRAPMTGWGQCLGAFVTENVRVENRAVCGKSLRSFLGKNWDGVLENLQKGDYVLIQFGHNDQKVPNPEEYPRTG